MLGGLDGFACRGTGRRAAAAGVQGEGDEALPSRESRVRPRGAETTAARTRSLRARWEAALQQTRRGQQCPEEG